MNLKHILFVSLCAIAFSMSATAGTMQDSDGDQVPDTFDNCVDTANGPAQASNQTDTDGDGLGNACDCDFVSPAPGDGVVLGNDILDRLANYKTSDELQDVTGDGHVLGEDILRCFSYFNGPPG